jgi:16S rRNA (adenine1518-N6/adenine1519-N6)-dimethyltransferase
MFQREVAERIVADEGEREDYGRLGVLCGWRTQARILFDVPPSAFVPPAEGHVERGPPDAAREPLPCRVGRWRPSPARPSASAARCCARA